MAVRVARLELSRLDDGRQVLLIELDDGQQVTTAEWFGELTADYLNPVSKEALVLDLHMALRAAPGNDLDQHWARLTVTNPRRPGPDLPIWP